MSYSLKKHLFRPRFGRRANRGIALIVVLSLIVMVCLLVVAFVTAMQMDRVSSASYGQSMAAEQIGQGALGRVVAELQNEMSADAPPSVVSGVSIYTNITSTNMMPQLIGTNSAMTNLVWASGPNGYTNASGTVVGTLLSTTVSSSTPSSNKRSMSIKRWGAPYLGDFPSDASLPKWILVTRNGMTNAGSFGATGTTLNNPAPANTNYAIGRFSYAVYNVGGLLDVTAAGYPASLSAAQINQLKGTVAGADLSVVGITNPDGFVNWRNTTTAANANAYLDYATNFASTNGFLRVAPGDTTFLSRQDLIKGAQGGQISGLGTNALQNLTVFTRELNQPSWGPEVNGTTTGFDYATQANTATSTNRFVPLVRFAGAATITSYRGDGTSFTYDVKAGSPVLQRRFFLGRLKWLGPQGPQNGGTTQSIQACFGLVWNGTNWVYAGNTGSAAQSTIKTLVQVASESREPNFFELLQAGILTGSLGVSSTPAVTNGTGSVQGAPTGHQESSMLQVLRIGAAIIDQYDSDSYPTVISYTETKMSPATTWQAVGIEDLPYFNSYRVVGGASPDTSDSLASYLTVGLWDPHRATTTPLARPDVRVRIQGTARVYTGYAVGPVLATIDPNVATSVLSIDSSAFHSPKLLAAGNVSSTPGPGTTAGMSWALTPPLDGSPAGMTAVAYRLPDLKLDLTKAPVNDITLYSSLSVSYTTAFQIGLEYKSPSGGWVGYSQMNGVSDPKTWMNTTSVTYSWLGSLNDTPNGTIQACKFGTGFNNYTSKRITGWTGVPAGFCQLNAYRLASDPRSLRFTALVAGGTSAIPPLTQVGNALSWTSSMTDTSYASAGYGYDRNLTGVPAAAVPPIISTAAYGNTANGSFFPSRLARNNTENTGTFTSYKDRDGIRRIGDSGMFQSSLGPATGNPSSGREADRPIILNRPFQSVAEMGYALRDDPWRTVDFFSATSADAGLLDLFSMTETSVIKSAGKIDLNSRNSKALEAVLRGSLTDVTAPGQTMSDPTTVAASLTAVTLTNALVNKSDLVTAFVGNTTALPGTTDEYLLKPQREAITRALSESGQTRTWNLLIDVVAQSGKYPPAATALDQFMVEGERRYWLHVAIDRITGEVVDQQLEQVTE